MSDNNNNTSHKKLNASIKIGSIKSKVNYNNNEKVFLIPDNLKNRINNIKNFKKYGRIWHHPKDKTFQSKYTTTTWLNMSQGYRDPLARKHVKTFSSPNKLTETWISDTDIHHNKINIITEHQIIENNWNQSILIDNKMYKLKPTVNNNYKSRSSGSKRMTLFQREAQRNEQNRKKKSNDRKFQKFQYDQEIVKKQFEDLSFSQIDTTLFGEASEIIHNTLHPKISKDNTTTIDNNNSLLSSYTTENLTQYLKTNESNDGHQSYTTKDLLFYKTHQNKKPVRLSAEQFLRRHERRKNDFIRYYFHDGIYKYSKIEDEDVWSCCLNPHEYSQGCKHKAKNIQQWNTESIG